MSNRKKIKKSMADIFDVMRADVIIGYKGSLIGTRIPVAHSQFIDRIATVTGRSHQLIIGDILEGAIQNLIDTEDDEVGDTFKVEYQS